MKRILIILACLFTLAGCGSHGYEGKYTGEVDLGFVSKSFKIEINDDSWTFFDGSSLDEYEIEDAYIEEEDGKEYLALKEPNGDITYFQIVDEDTLMLDFEIFQIKFDKLT